jgi:hypothetical protein
MTTLSMPSHGMTAASHAKPISSWLKSALVFVWEAFVSSRERQARILIDQYGSK